MSEGQPTWESEAHDSTIVPMGRLIARRLHDIDPWQTDNEPKRHSDDHIIRINNRFAEEGIFLAFTDAGTAMREPLISEDELEESITRELQYREFLRKVQGY